MKIEAFCTRIFLKDQNLVDFILEHTQEKLKEDSILAVTSKIVSLAEGRTVKKAGRQEKAELIKKECDHYLGELAYDCHLTIQHGLLVPSAGIDESNSAEGEYILYPKDPYLSARKIWKEMREKTGIKNLGVILTDSRTFPLRRGVGGVALAYSGFKALKSLIGKEDLFQRPLQMTTINLVDALAAGAVLVMGEGAEQCPLALIEDFPLVFVDKTDSRELNISIEEDLYSPLLSRALTRTDF